MASQMRSLHFVLFPFMSQGHMIPLIDIGKLLAQEGVMVSVITTPINAKRYATVAAHAVESGLHMQFIEVPLPCEQVGLPSKCECLDMISSLGLSHTFVDATDMLREPVERLFEQLTPRPSCIISDPNLPFTAEIAKIYSIPRIVFTPLSAFSLLCGHNLYVHKVLDKVTSDTEPFVVPGLPDRIELTKSQLPLAMAGIRLEFVERVMAAEKATSGIIINSFEELDPAYIQGFREAKEYKVWYVGPVSLSNRDSLEKAHRGNQPTLDESECLKWLDSQQPGSVIYACLGSICNLTAPQLIELGLGLEASNKPFIWVIRGGQTSQGLDKWLAEDGFEERIKDRGLLIRGWAPQIIILSHTAIGGFLTHSGWGSTVEAVSAGLPMVTWPLFGDQFCNEKLVVEVLRIGVSVGSKVTMRWGEEEKLGVLVKKEDVKNAIQELMNQGTESEERRKRVQELSKMAKKATAEGGSSHLNLTSLIQYVMQHESS